MKSKHHPLRQKNSKASHLWIYGIHAVAAVLSNKNRKIYQFVSTKNALAKVIEITIARELWKADPIDASPNQISNLLHDGAVHQGIAVQVDDLAQPDLDEVLAEKTLIVLDKVTDPQNVGAILRSAAAFDAGAVILAERQAPPPCNALAKAATGALEHIPYIRVTNIARSLESINNAGYKTIGLAGEATEFLDSALQGVQPTCLVLGSEGSGLRHLTRQKCMMLAKISISSAISSLNVSNAAAIALYEASKSV